MEQHAFRLQEIFHLPKWRCLVARREDGEYICSMMGGQWFTREQFEKRLEAERVKDTEKQKDMAKFDEAVAAAKHCFFHTADLAGAPLSKEEVHRAHLNHLNAPGGYLSQDKD